MKRAGVTEKVSVSIPKNEMRILRARAKRMHGGNLSAVFVEMASWIVEQEARAKVVDWLGGPVSEAERDEIRRELRGEAHTKTKKRERPAA